MAGTIKDVAREAGVNISTVSRALNGAYGVHKETRERVLAVAARLSYRPNRVARGLVTGRSHTFGLIVSDIGNPFFAYVARGAEDAARIGGCDLILCNSYLDPVKQMGYVRSLTDKQVDGIMMFSVGPPEQLATCPVPVVLLNGVSRSNSFSTVTADNDAGGVLAARHLLDLGHRRIAHITGPRQHVNMTERARSFVREVRSALGVDPVVVHGENSLAGAHDLAREVLGRRPRPTAIFCGNDVMAFGIMRAATELGLQVPGDVSLIGFDDIELASVMHPALTTIRQPSYEIGRAAAQILLGFAGDKGKPWLEHRVFGVELVERKSCRRLA